MTSPAISPVRLKTVLRRSGQTADLNDGRVDIEGIKIDFVDVNPPIAAYRRMVRDLEFDMCELAPTTYFIARAHGAPFRALPVFLTRRFHHHGLVAREDAGIKTPKDLEGRRVGVRAYSVTTGVWTRGILSSEYGLDASTVTWVVDDEEHVTQLRLPPNVVHAPHGQSLASMMAAGALDAAFTGNAGIGREGPPTAGWEAKKPPKITEYQELLPDWRGREAEWHHRTGIYPFHNVVVIKDEILAAHPWIAKKLYAAFIQAKARWLQGMRTGHGHSREDEDYRELMALVGDDPLPYGITPNRASIEALIGYSVQQGLMPRPLAVEELFVDPDASSSR